jgi:putative glycosyltransferase (TIGR04372 family)
MKIDILGVKQNLFFIIYKLFTSRNYNLFKIIISLFFLLLIIILYPVIKIKIIEIETRAIGHFSTSIEIFLSEIKYGYIKKKGTFFLCFTNKRVANKFLLKKWKNYLFIKNFFFLEIAFMFLTKYYFLGKFFLPYRHWRNHKTWQLRDTHNLLPKTSPFIIFNNKEKKLGEKLLKKISIRNSEEYFCFFARDHSYRNQFETDGKDSVRNSNVNDQLKGIQLIINKNLKAVRVGSVVNEKLSIKNSNIIDYPSSGFRSDFLDVFLIFHCNFMISTGSGIENLATLNRKKVLQVNYIGLENLHNLSNDIYFPIILPKKYINLKTKKLLTFKEIFQSRLHSESFLKKDLVSIGFALIDNTENEIKDAILEMDKFIKSKKETAFEKDNANNEFWEIYKFYHNGYCPQNIKISEKFLHKNKKLLS